MPSSLTLQIKSLLEKIEENPYDGDLYFNVAVLQQRNGDCDEAIHNYSCAISYKTNIAEAYFRLAQLCNKLNDIDLAIAHINKAISINNTIAKYYELLGNFRWRNSEIDEAENNYLKCLQLAPESPRPHFRLSKMYESQELLHKAIDEIEVAVLFDDKNPLYLHQYSELMVKTGALDKAVKYKREAQLRAPEKYPFIYEDIVARCMLYSGEVVVIPVGFRCYTKGKLYKLLSFKQVSLPFDSGFFPPSSISSVLKSSRIKLSMNSHTVCIKNEKVVDEKLGLGIKFESSDYNTINSLLKENKHINRYVDSTYGYYTLDKVHNFVLAHYNWHTLASIEKSKGIYDPEQNILNINNILNNRIKRLFEMCDKAKHIIFVFGETQGYKFMSIDEDIFMFSELDKLKKEMCTLFNREVMVTTLDSFNSPRDVLNLISDLQ